jgi:hypothetical protein
MNNVTIKLTNEQQKQIRDATGKNLTELNINLPAADSLTEKELGQVFGGAGGASFDVLKLKPW